MNKEIVKRILTNNTINISDLNTFITEYVYEKLNRDITAEELKGIVQMIQAKIFNLRFAVLEAAKMLNLDVFSVFDKNGNLIRTDVYESV